MIGIRAPGRSFSVGVVHIFFCVVNNIGKKKPHCLCGPKDIKDMKLSSKQDWIEGHKFEFEWFLLPISWSFVISSPCTALCCSILSVSHFSWTQFGRQPPIMKKRHIAGWAFRGVRRLCLNVCSSCKCEIPLWNVYIKPGTRVTSHTQCHFQSLSLSTWWKLRCVCVPSRMLQHNTAPWWHRAPVQTPCRGFPRCQLPQLCSH